jgi:hypothetical protein
MSTIKVDSWSLSVIENEPRVTDVDLRDRLEYGDIYKFRQRIRELRREDPGNFSPMEVPTERVETRGGRPGKLFWLCEAEALFIATQIATPKARALTHEIIRVFMLARRGMLDSAQTGELRAELAALRERFTALEQTSSRLWLDGGMLGHDRAKMLSARIERIARCMFLDKSVPSVRSGQQKIRQKLAQALKWGGSGCSWDRLPLTRQGELEAVLASIENDLIAQSKARAKAANATNVVQMVLPITRHK